MNEKAKVVLDLLKRGELLSARQIEINLGWEPDPGQWPVRNAIGTLRAASEPIWKDAKGFWWRDDEPVLPVGVPNRWKRKFIH